MINSTGIVDGLERNKVYCGIRTKTCVRLENGIVFETEKFNGMDYPILASYSMDNDGKVNVYQLGKYGIEEVFKKHNATEVIKGDLFSSMRLTLEQFNSLKNGDEVLLFDSDGYFNKITYIGDSTSNSRKVFKKGSNLITVGLEVLDRDYKLYPLNLARKEQFLIAKKYLEEKIMDYIKDIESMEEEIKKL